MNDDSKNDDWGMTTPNFRFGENERKAADEFAPKYESAAAPPPPPVDDWGMTAANINIPPAAAAPPPAAPPASQPLTDFDKTTPNLNVPPGYTKNSAGAPPASHDDWGMTEANLQLPKETKKDDWQMPQPVFRISSGETPSFDKTMPNINFRQNAAGYSEDDGAAGQTTPYFRLPDEQAPAAEQTPPAVPPPVSEQFSAAEAEPKPAAKTGGGNMKYVLMLGGLFAFFLVVTAALVAAYYFFIYSSPSVTSVQSANTSKAPAAAPATETPAAAPPAATDGATLPAGISYRGEMVLVAEGEFTMGSDSGEDQSKPAHQTVLPAFYIDRTEVTNAQYKEFCEATGKQPPPDPFWDPGYFAKRPNAPVLGVSFDDAKAFAEWAGKRLPTEAEWEKAASWNAAARSKTDFPWGSLFTNEKAAFNTARTSDVGSFPSGASPSGALDMAGNAAEWVDAYFQPYPGNTTANSAFGSVNRVVRGGHFGSKANEHLKTTRRVYVPPTVASGEDEEKLFAAAIGFRCAVSADDPRVQEAVLRK